MESANARNERSPWWWIPTLYLAEGIPYILINTVSALMYKRMGASLSDIALYTSLFYLPWVIKPLWGPLVDLYYTKRMWTVVLQFIMGFTLLGVAAVLQIPAFWFGGTLILFWLMAFQSATHDIAADGLYAISLNEKQQAGFIGVRSTFYRIAIIAGQGILVMAAGLLETSTGPQPYTLQVSAGPTGVARPAPVEDTSAGAFVVVEPKVVSLDAGSSQTVGVTLAKAPQTTVGVTISNVPKQWYGHFFAIGPERLITTLPEQRIEFGPNNWNTSQSLVVTANERLPEAVVANLRIGSGNIPLSWGACLAGLGVMILMFGCLHAVVLPRPATDRGTTANVTFYQATSWLFIAVAVPAGLVAVILWFVPEQLASLAKPYFEGKPDIQKTLPDLSKFTTLFLIVLVSWFVFSFRSARRAFTSFFSGSARQSGIPFDTVFYTFFAKKGILTMIALLLLYRLGDAMLSKMGGLFMVAERAEGGMGLSTTQVGFVYGTMGIVGLTVGGILGGIALAAGGLRKWFLLMAFLTNAPNMLYAYLAYAQPLQLTTVLACVVTEQFFYGFGFAAYMLYMLRIAGDGEFKTSHFALCTGFMALSMMLPGMLCGVLFELLGSWKAFFYFVAVVSFLGVAIVPFAPMDDKDKVKKVATGE